MTTSSLQYVIRNNGVIGFLMPCAKGWKSYDQDGQSLGLFDSEDLAARAVYERAESKVDL